MTHANRWLPAALAALCLLSCGAKPTADPTPTSALTEATTAAPTVSTTEPPTTTEPITEPPVTTAPQPEVKLPTLAFFLDDLSKNYTVLTTYASHWTNGIDVGCFGLVPDGRADGAYYYSDFWNRAASEYPALADYRIGYELCFSLTDGTAYFIPIRTAADTVGDYNRYLEVWIYDDVHQVPGAWYSHLLESQMKPETLITSIKLTAAAGIDAVKEITLTAYLYADEGEFTSDGHYAGVHAVTLPIARS